jgi:hypothetical protein
MTKEQLLIEKLREMKDVAKAFEDEAAGLRSRARGLDKQARAKRDEMDRLLAAFQPGQGDLFVEPDPTGWRCENCGKTFETNPGVTHAVTVPSDDDVKTYDCGPVRAVAGELPAEDEEAAEEEEAEVEA